MFEQATLSNGPAGVRAWTTFLGLGSQVALVSVAVLVPMVWPQVLPMTRLVEVLTPPLPPAPPKPLGELKHVPTSGRVLKAVLFPATMYQPPSVPSKVYAIVDEPVGNFVVGSPAGFGDSSNGAIGSILDRIGEPARVPPPIAAATPKPAAPPTPAIVRYREGGNVLLGTLLHRVEPPYPTIAKAARVSGTVELECVVGVDGRIKEVKVKSGNPLLVRAAVDAAWQWAYAPSKLNGSPIEIITNLVFTFKLN